MKRNLLERYKIIVFPQKSIDTWNGLKEEMIMANNLHQLKEKLDKYRYEDRTTRVQLTDPVYYNYVNTHRKIGFPAFQFCRDCKVTNPRLTSVPILLLGEHLRRRTHFCLHPPGIRTPNISVVSRLPSVLTITGPHLTCYIEKRKYDVL